MDLTSETTADTLLFIAQTFFLPPQRRNVLPDANNSAPMNTQVRRDHPWASFNHSLASLCTLHASRNDVFAVMLFPSGAERDESTDLEDIGKVDRVRFLCATNQDPSSKTGSELRQYVSDCLMKILVASEKVEAGPGKLDETLINDFIIHVYSRGWTKFCGRMTKAGYRGRRLVRLLQNPGRQNGRGRKPPGLPHLVQAMNDMLNIIDTPEPLANKDYVNAHKACTRVRQEAFENRETKNWLIGLYFLNHHGERNTEGSTPFRILQKMVKLRNGIETLFQLVRNPEMRRTFEAARAARDEGTHITWVPSAPPSARLEELVVDLSLQNASIIKQTYKDALLVFSDDGANHGYATEEDVWKRIMTDTPKITVLPPASKRLPSSGATFGIPVGVRQQHCEGKLLRHVIKSNLLGKVFPYIGCSKLCCEPCFTAIRAVNELIRESGWQKPEKLYFAVHGTHRKIYAGFGITPITGPEGSPNTQLEDSPNAVTDLGGFDTSALLTSFHKFLCRDIGLMVQAHAVKGSGGSDSDP